MVGRLAEERGSFLTRRLLHRIITPVMLKASENLFTLRRRSRRPGPGLGDGLRTSDG